MCMVMKRKEEEGEDENGVEREENHNLHGGHYLGRIMPLGN